MQQIGNSFYENRFDQKPRFTDEEFEIVDKYTDAFLDGEFSSIEELRNHMAADKVDQDLQQEVLLIVG